MNPDVMPVGSLVKHKAADNGPVMLVLDVHGPKRCVELWNYTNGQFEKHVFDVAVLVPFVETVSK